MIEFWKVQNTGWSGGTSWFDIERRFSTELEAEVFIDAKKKYFRDESIKWRPVHVTIEVDKNKKVTTEQYSSER